MNIPYGNLLGRALNLLRKGDRGTAETICQHVLDVDPRNSTALYLAGVIAHDRHDYQRSLDLMERALQARPDFDDALCGRGVARRHLGQGELADADFQRTLELNPQHAQALYQLGLALLERSNVEEAERHFELALAADPNLAPAIANLGFIRHRQQRLDDAVRLYSRALELQPSLGVARNNLAGALQELGRASEALALLQRLDATNTDPVVGMNLLTCLNLVAGKPAASLEAARSWAQRFADPLPPVAGQRSTEINRRLRIGYIAGSGLARHTLAMTYLPLMEAHDRDAFEIIAYSDLPAEREDDVSRRAQAAVSAWRRTGALDDAALAELIAADRIDIAVDGNGFAAGSRLLALARRPAPLQLHFPAMATTGMAAIDYIVGDARVIPPGMDRWFSEKVWRLPCAYLYRPLDDLPDVGPAPAIRNGYVTFGSFNRIAKVSPEAVAAWAAVLQAVPRSRLVIKSTVGLSADAIRRYEGLFQSRGVAAERLEFRDRTRDEVGHLRQFNDIDIGLDTLPFGGVVTTFGALAMGVPVVTLCGARILDRYGAMILETVGLAAGIADDIDAYVARAKMLADDTAKLNDLRQTLRARLLQSPLCNATTFARSLEEAYREMWQRRRSAAQA